MRYWTVIVASSAFSVAALSQTMVGYGAAVGRAGVAGAGIGIVGKGTSDLLEKSVQGMNRVQNKKGQVQTQVEEAAEPASEVAVNVPSKQPGRRQGKNPVIDPAAIPIGLGRDELINQFGKPSAATMQQQGDDVLETCWYRSPGYDAVVVTLRNGKVTAVGT